MTSTAFQIDQWAAWAPGLATQDAWLAWLSSPGEISLEDGQAIAPPLVELSPMIRRRIDPLGRIVLQAAWWAQGERPAGPVVFASRWGELARSIEMLQQLAVGEPLSPTSFSLSVHNALSSLFSIARGDTHNYLAVSAGEFSLEAGFTEAVGLLADGAERVLVIFVDHPLPGFYANFEREEDRPARFPYAFACMLKRAIGVGIKLSTRAGGVSALDMPSNLDLLNFLLGRSADKLQRQAASGTWIWQRLESPSDAS